MIIKEMVSLNLLKIEVKNNIPKDQIKLLGRFHKNIKIKQVYFE